MQNMINEIQTYAWPTSIITIAQIHPRNYAHILLRDQYFIDPNKRNINAIWHSVQGKL